MARKVSIFVVGLKLSQILSEIVKRSEFASDKIMVQQFGYAAGVQVLQLFNYTY